MQCYVVETLAFQIFHLSKALSSCRVASWDFSRVPLGAFVVALWASGLFSINNET